MVLSLLFYASVGLVFIASLLVVVSKNPVYSVLALIIACVSTAILWLLLEYEFLAITLVLVYVGAVMVLFLFVVMFLDIDLTTMTFSIRKSIFTILVLSPLFLLLLLSPFLMVLLPGFSNHLFDELKPSSYSHISELGQELFTNYLSQFVLSGFILLVAIIIAISVTLRKREGVRYTHPDKQIATSKNDRVSIVRDMKP